MKVEPHLYRILYAQKPGRKRDDAREALTLGVRELGEAKRIRHHA